MSIEAEPLNVLSIYDGFFSGGARIVHTNLIADLHQSGDQNHSVLSVNSQVFRENTAQDMHHNRSYQQLVAAGVPVRSLGRSALTGPDLSAFSEFELGLYGQMAAEADVIVTLKEQPLRLLLAAERIVDKPVIACLHRSDPGNQGSALEDLDQALSTGVVDGFTTCSLSSLQAYDRLGISAAKGTVIFNGVNLEMFKFQTEARSRLRYELDIATDAPVILLAARYDGMKNIPLFLAAAGRYLAAEPSSHIIMCGAGMSADNQALLADIDTNVGPTPSATSRIHLLGIQEDMPALYSAADIVSLTSTFGEAYPLCLLEGMACGAIPVSTDVGDTAAMLEGRGLITDQCPVDIADKWQTAFAERHQWRLTPEQRESLSHHTMNRAYQSVFQRYAGLYSPLSLEVVE